MSSVLEESLVIEEIYVDGYEKNLKIVDEKAGLKAIISIHNTSFGPAVGGTRIYPYATFQEALDDVLRLSKGMTYKSAISESGVGGGKSVIIANPKTQKTKKMLVAFAKAVDSLKGQYICAEDSGSTTEDMHVISQVTPYVAGLAHEKGSGDPSPFTAWGVFRGIQSVIQRLDGTDSLVGKTVAVQGLGNVGSRLAEILFWAGAKLIVADLDGKKALELAQKYSGTACRPDEILKVECDVLAPCALGGAINSFIIPDLKCRAVAGAANNQLLKDADADELKKRGILYAPDFVINSGGLINVLQELVKDGYDSCASRSKIHTIYDQLLVIYDIAEQNRSSTHDAALALCDYRLKYKIGKREKPLYFHHAGVIV